MKRKDDLSIEMAHTLAIIEAAKAKFYKYALENAFIAMGQAGANADTKHPLRSAWEAARAALDISKP